MYLYAFKNIVVNIIYIWFKEIFSNIKDIFLKIIITLN